MPNDERAFAWIQGALAVLLTGTGCLIVVIAVVEGRPIPEIPSWLVLAIGAVVGLFFGPSLFKGGVRTATNGMLAGASKIAQIQEATNGQSVPPTTPQKAA